MTMDDVSAELTSQNPIDQDRAANSDREESGTSLNTVGKYHAVDSYYYESSFKVMYLVINRGTNN